MKRGSALLVVLGMVAFMVVSAVAFSAYMRASRLPNSYLRRASASRLLAKAAVAAAIDQVDAAIGNNPHPGLGTLRPRPNAGLTTSGSAGSENLLSRNYWTHRVYIGTNQFHAASETISPLCVEALAYIPPPLVNEARYYSRRSDAAVWRRLGFDSGRYVFCALDVSDYFDVNALAANVGRGASPATRLSLAYLCENAAHTGYDMQPSAWDQFMQDFRGTSAAEQEVDSAGSTSGGASAADPNLVPLVSVADLNLALWDKKPGDFTSYFGQYFGGAGSGSFYGGATTDSAAGEKVKRMTFVTDGYYPPSEGSDPNLPDDDKDYDLADETCQPFTRADLKTSKVALRAAMDQQNSPTARRLIKGLSKLGLALLWDYLDTDSVPLSLAIPSVERAPMLASVSQTLPGNIAISKNVLPENADETSENYPQEYVADLNKTSEPWTRKIGRVTHYSIDPASFSAALGNGFIQATLVYPFRRDILVNVTVEGHLALFFVSGVRGNANPMELRFSDPTALRPVDAKTLFTRDSQLQNGVFHVRLQSEGKTFSNVETQSQAVQDVHLSARGGAAAVVSALQGTPLLTVVEEIDQQAPAPAPDSPADTPRTWQTVGTRIVQSTPAAGSATTGCAFPPVTDTGAPDPKFTSSAAVADYLNGSQDRDFTLHAAVWLRVVDSNNDTVDLVPANLVDDEDFNGVRNAASMRSRGPKIAGADYPLMRFASRVQIPFSIAELDARSTSRNQQSFDLQPAGVMCSDPRWNWAPEHWWKVDSAVSATDWLQNCQVGQDNRDRDIFMMASDAGYMQSVYELAMLPRVTNADLTTYGPDDIVGALETPAGLNDWARDFADTRNSGLMWRTYCPYARNGVARDAFENVGVNGNTGRIVCEGGGTKVCPYSDSTNVMMAAFANTPTDWWSAAAQAESGVGVEANTRKDAETFNKNYAFNTFADQSISRFGWEDLREVAENFMERVRGANNANVDWEACFNDLDWNGEDFQRIGGGVNNDTRSFCGSDFSDSMTLHLSDVDRRFLYGYWRECFAVRQQLFLVFVRAEPLMMGGGASRQVPPQLGVRAMALVWRDPTPAVDEQTPHRTRVLFYRQFE